MAIEFAGNITRPYSADVANDVAVSSRVILTWHDHAQALLTWHDRARAFTCLGTAVLPGPSSNLARLNSRK